MTPSGTRNAPPSRKMPPSAASIEPRQIRAGILHVHVARADARVGGLRL